MENIKGKGMLVGIYNEQDLAEGKDKADVAKLSKETGLKYTNTELIKKRGKVVGMKVYLCNKETFKI